MVRQIDPTNLHVTHVISILKVILKAFYNRNVDVIIYIFMTSTFLL